MPDASDLCSPHRMIFLGRLRRIRENAIERLRETPPNDENETRLPDVPQPLLIDFHYVNYAKRSIVLTEYIHGVHTYENHPSIIPMASAWERAQNPEDLSSTN